MIRQLINKFVNQLLIKLSVLTYVEAQAHCQLLCCPVKLHFKFNCQVYLLSVFKNFLGSN